MNTCTFCNKPVDEDGVDYAPYGDLHAHKSCSDRFTGDAPFPTEVGQWVVVDPTGRDLLDCAEVGVVTELYDIPAGLAATVRLNSGETVGEVTYVFTVLAS